MTLLKGTIASEDGATASVQVLLGDTVPPPPSDGLQVPVGANRVRVQGRGTFPLAAVNPTTARNGYPNGRGPNELVLVMEGTQTAFNAYGVQVQVLPSGLVPLRATAMNVTVPVGGGVLSGHDNGTPTSAAAFVRSLQPGDVVVFEKADVTTDPPPPASTGSPFPTWVVETYWQQYQGPALDKILTTMPGYNVCFAAFALGQGGQNMTFSPRSYSAYAGSQGEQLFTDHVAAWKKSGRVMGISIGGGVDADSATVLRTDADGAAAYGSLARIIDKYGFTAVDDDLENGPEGFTYEGLKGLFSRLRKAYGPSFGLSAAPRPYEDFHLSILGRLYADGLLDLCTMQFYDAMETRSTSFLSGWIPDRTAAAVSAGVPVGIQAPGTCTWSGYQKGWNSVDVYLSIITSIPGIRGAMNWEASLDERMGGTFAAKFAAARPAGR